jgi:hypothetical protein
MKSFVISAVVMSVLSMLLGMVVHGMILHGDYGKLPTLFRPEADAQNYLPFMLFAHLLMGTGITWIYRQGNAVGKAWAAQGVRFGIGWAVAVCIPTYLIYYAVQPMPSSLVTKQIMFDCVATIVLGLAVAFLNRNASKSSFA